MIRACSVEDVPLGEGRALTVGDRRIAVFRTPTGWYALDNACPHAGGPLADGIVADRTVICPLHERRFDLSSGEGSNGEQGVRCYAVQVHGSDVFLEPVARDSPRTA